MNLNTAAGFTKEKVELGVYSATFEAGVESTVSTMVEFLQTDVLKVIQDVGSLYFQDTLNGDENLVDRDLSQLNQCIYDFLKKRVAPRQKHLLNMDERLKTLFEHIFLLVCQEIAHSSEMVRGFKRFEIVTENKDIQEIIVKAFIIQPVRDLVEAFDSVKVNILDAFISYKKAQVISASLLSAKAHD